MNEGLEDAIYKDDSVSQSDFLVFCQANRSHSIGQTTVLVDAFTDRLFPTFDNIEEEAERATQDAWKRLNERPGYDDGPV